MIDKFLSCLLFDRDANGRKHLVPFQSIDPNSGMRSLRQ
jgi:hypothetical protein